MKRLIIIANPHQTSFSHALATSYVRGFLNCKCNLELEKCECNKNDSAYEILDLYKTNLKQDFLTLTESDNTETKNIIQEKIKNSDEIAFFTPMWWGHVPAILKNFIDVNFSSGFAYKMKKGGIVSKLLTGKNVVVMMTCDAPGWIYFLISIPVKVIFSFITFSYCGMKVRVFRVFPAMIKSTLQRRENWLKYSYRIGSK